MAADSTIAAVANKVTVVGGGATFLVGGMTANEVAAFGGLAVAVISLLVQAFYKWRANKRHELADKRATDEHAARMELLKKELGRG